MSGELENDVGRFWVDDDGLLRCVVKQGTEQTRAQAMDSMRIFRELATGVARPTIIDTSKVKGLNREARACYTSRDAAEVFAAVALVVSTSTVARTLVNFIMAVNAPIFPVKMFDSTDDALPWARTFLPQR